MEVIKADNLHIDLRNKIVEISLLQYNKSYEHGKMGPDSFDCAGLLWYLYNCLFNINIFNDGVGLSTTTMLMTSNYGKLTLFKECALNKDLNLIKKGDILFFHRQSLKDIKPKANNKYPGHCGLYLGNNKFIHASRPKKRVIINNIEENSYWLDVLVGSKNLINDIKVLEKIKK